MGEEKTLWVCDWDDCEADRGYRKKRPKDWREVFFSPTPGAAAFRFCPKHVAALLALCGCDVATWDWRD